jgi:hypothetical protein
VCVPSITQSSSICLHVRVCDAVLSQAVGSPKRCTNQLAVALQTVCVLVVAKLMRASMLMVLQLIRG